MSPIIILKDKGRFIVVAVLLFTAFVCYFPEISAGKVKEGASYRDGSLTMEAKNASLVDLLEAIAQTAGIDIFVGQGFHPAGGRMACNFSGEPLENVLRSLLRGFNYAAVYVKEGDDFRIASLKIYPEGQQGGAFTPLFRGAKPAVAAERMKNGQTVTVLVNSGGAIVRQGDLAARQGVLGPAETHMASAGAPEVSLREPWFALQLQTEQDEAARFADLLMLRKQAQSATDPQRKQSLAMVYADEAAKFEAFKKANQNKIESLKRISQFQEINGQ